MPFDISLLPEQELRPWAETKELDEAVDGELTKINEAMNFNMAMKNAGFMGHSELDEEMPEFKDFKEMVEKPGWMGYDEPEEGEEEEGKSLEEIVEEYENSDTIEGPVNDNMELTEDPIINQAIGKLNNLTTKLTRGKLARLRRMNLLPIETMRKKKAKKKLASVRHNPHYSMSPAFRAESSRGMSRSGLRSSGGSAFEPNLDVDFYSIEGNEDNSLFEQEFRDPMFAPPDPQAPILDVLLPRDTAQPDNLEDLKAAKEELKKILGEEKVKTSNQSNPPSAGRTVTGPLLDSLDEQGRKRPTSSLASIAPAKGFSLPKTAPAGLNELPALYESPEKSGRNPPMSPQLKPLSKSQSEGALKLHQQQGGGTKRRPSTGIPSSARGSARGSGRKEDVDAQSGALAKLGIGTNASSNTLSKKEEFIIDKKKLKKVRTFRDQLMTIAGAMGAYGRENDGTVMDSAIDKEAARKESIALTQKMCSETMERNRVDQTWDLIVTPGFMESQGADQVFKSQQTMDFEMTPAYEKAFAKGVLHPELCIQKDELRIWSESAVQSGIKIFQGGGTMKS